MRSCRSAVKLPSSLKRQYGVTDVRFDILKLYALARAGCWEEVRQLYAARRNIIPIEVLVSEFLRVVFPSGGSGSEGVYRGRLLSQGDECQGITCLSAALCSTLEVGLEERENVVNGKWPPG